MFPIPEVTDVDIAFPATPHALPAWEDIPEDFRENWHRSDHPWCRIPAKWFYEGGSYDEFGLTPKEDVDFNQAARAIKNCLGSFQPSHEHKMAGVAYLLSEWFDMSPSTEGEDVE